MSNKWTDEQRQAIDLRNCSILVSAAAGSGKTAVLVERILQKVTDENNPVNIDSMVVVTFTKAAAGEMRERIRLALEKLAAANPENAHLQKQKTLIHNANITTIDSFCSMILRNHFEKIDLDPAFRVADNGETNLLQKEAVEDLLEEYYQKEENGELSGKFANFVECYASDKNDKVIEDYILKIYSFAMSYPYPEKWLDKCEEMYECEDLEHFEKLDWVQLLKEDALNLANHAYNAAKTAYEIASMDGGPYMYIDTLTDYLYVSKALCNCSDYSSAYDILTEFKPKALSRKKDKNVNEELRELAKKYRDEVKAALDELTKKYYYINPERVCQDMFLMKENAHVFVSLVKDFIRIYGAKKKEKDLLDFSDLEHFVLKILLDENGEPTDVAKEYASHFDEIMIDEYQDSNFVQELLLSSISKRSDGAENVFMVGDAKQSIYRFRMARPEIFTDKYDSYSTTDGDRRRVDLFKNFRSRKEVLYSINYIFEHIMKKSLGGIEYNNEASLHPGLEFSAGQDEAYYNTQIMLFEKKQLDKDIMSSHEFEARMIAMQIKNMVLSDNPFMVTDKSSGKLRECRFSDIAILTRSNAALASECVKIFKKMDIPLFVPSKNGYFTTEEIDTMLNMLRVIDNPMQDIPIAATLKSPVYTFSDNDMAMISTETEGCCFYEKLKNYVNQNDDEISLKINNFLDELEFFRNQVNILPLHEFIWLILDKTGYGDYVMAMQNGQQKKANIDAFVQKAIDFEKTSYIGIFQFVQYIEQIKKYNVDEGEVSIINEQDNTVRLMTIHKSKGLEFPVVFVSGLGNRFNRRDESASIVMHSDLGIGLDFADAVSREKRSTILKHLIGSRIHAETVAEELRVLYVALTRAKEKLILTGAVSDIISAVSKAAFSNRNEEIDSMTLINGTCYLDWILASLNNHSSMKMLCNDLGIQKQTYFKITQWECGIEIFVKNVEDLIADSVLDEMTDEQNEFDFDTALNKTEISDEIRKMLEFEYPYAAQNMIPVKLSVSELKHDDYEANSVLPQETENLFEDTNNFYSEEIQDSKEDNIIYPKFIKEGEDKVSGAAKGTLYHKVFEKIDYAKTDTDADLRNQIDRLFDDGIIEKQLKPYVKYNDFEKFINSQLGQRMKMASEKKLLWREQPFMIGINSDEIYDDCEKKMILVQGIIDAFFIEDNEIVLVDYKTDYVKIGMESVLIKRYKKQMDYYEKAISRMFEKKVKERIIYSVKLNKEIQI